MTASHNDPGHEIIDLDRDDATVEADSPRARCSCGVRRTVLRHNAVSPCAGRAMARLKEAHPEEYGRYLRDAKAEALAEFETTWRRHLAGDHSQR
ncbi:hypothetical protein [Mycolicibacterium chlorophenolicum]|uniref:Uncharacterized protein n=1 Tax=Mycolicibacterium chlorophenolicum TaxID=37916 RepID=A0A0J6WIT6_9MYCO|nr:hypothetical protein [Mycolicibacterium chlorophenolicum]KMO82494.1 hypothetical protein MCHLDSM_01117 [Mycolicibacterium chlorophenolicum]